jgi:hypothetical protein
MTDHHHNPTKRKHFPAMHLLAVVVVSFMLLLGAYTKLTMHPDAVSLFDRLNLLPFMKSFGIIQIIIAFCLWWKPLRIIGTLIASAYFGAGAVMMLSVGESALVSTVLLVLVWIIHKCSWWSMWHHGYHCSCRTCATNTGMLPKETSDPCPCNKPGCRCVKGACVCE